MGFFVVVFCSHSPLLKLKKTKSKEKTKKSDSAFKINNLRLSCTSLNEFASGLVWRNMSDRVHI